MPFAAPPKLQRQPTKDGSVSTAAAGHTFMGGPPLMLFCPPSMASGDM